MRQQQSLPLTRGFSVLSLCVHRSSVFTSSDQGLYVLIHTAFCAAQALATTELWLSFLVKSNGSGFGEHSGMVFKKILSTSIKPKIYQSKQHLNPAQAWPGLVGKQCMLGRSSPFPPALQPRQSY